MYKVSVSCESLPRSHSAVVCGGWHLALRLSCLPPPLFSALQWDHVVLLISQQWPYSLPFPLFSLPLSPHFLIPSCLHLLPSPTHTHAADYFAISLQLSRRLSSLYYVPPPICFFFLFSPQTPARLHPAAHSPSSLEPWLSLASSPSFTRASKYPLAATVTPEEKYILDSVMELHPNKTTQSKVCVSLTCQSFLVVFPHGHKVLQTGVELVQNPLKPTNNRTFLTISPHTVFWWFWQTNIHLFSQ